MALVLDLSAAAQDVGIPHAAELEIALAKLNVLGSILYFGAHPDDENAAVLAYLSKGRKYRTAYLSLTRGEGGQNLIGPEQGAEFGIIRTQELMAARRIDGAEQFFATAIDFGFSKSAEETFEFWGKERILGDIVWVIRKFRPDVIMSRFAAEDSSGHGHHRAAGLLIEEAFSAAADPHRFPEQLKSASPWKAKRLLWNIFRPTPEETKGRLRIDTGKYNPLLGKSYAEIGSESRSLHKSQGTGSAGRRGARYEYFEVAAGEPATDDLFEGIDTSWNRVPGGRNVGLLLAECLKSFDPRHPSKSLSGLLGVDAELDKLPQDHWVGAKKKDLSRVIQACAGIWMEAIANDFAAAPGDAVRVQTFVVNRSDHPFVLHSLAFPEIAPDSIIDRSLDNNDPLRIDRTLQIPKDFPLSQPYWLETVPREKRSSAERQDLFGLAGDPPAVSVKIGLSADGHLLEYFLPLLFRWTDPEEGERYRPFEIRPRLTIQAEDTVYIFADENPKKISIRLKSHSPNVSGLVRLTGPDPWRITPASRAFSLAGKYEEGEVTFDIVPPKTANAADLTVEAEIGEEKISRALVDISYPHIYRQVYFPASRLKVLRLDVKTEGKRLGYIMGAGDDVSGALQSLGYDVTLLNDPMLKTMDLSRFDAILTGVRAYNTRESLRLAKERLLQYVEHGGALVVQYTEDSPPSTDGIGPYPLTIGRERVCTESAPVVFLTPGHPLLNFPNKITPKDFEGWIQERGLRFASEWDEKYEPVLACHDPHESDKKGGLLYARFGKGVFIYTGYALFRQLPAGVPGAFRLLANIVAAGKYAGGSGDEKD